MTVIYFKYGNAYLTHRVRGLIDRSIAEDILHSGLTNPSACVWIVPSTEGE